MAPVKYGWYVRNGSGLFLALKASRGYYGLALMFEWHRDRRDADHFATWDHGRDFLAWLYSAPVTINDDSLHLIDYAELLPIEPDADKTPVRTAAEVHADAMSEDRAREAIRRANWAIRPAVAMALYSAIEVERWFSSVASILARGHA